MSVLLAGTLTLNKMMVQDETPTFMEDPDGGSLDQAKARTSSHYQCSSMSALPRTHNT